MSDLIKIRRGTATQLASYTPGNGEMVWATDTLRMYVGDGTTPGGKVIGREILTSARTYYVRTNGSDSNNGLSNTAGGAFLTLQRAVNAAYSLDTAGYAISILVANGTYTTGVTITGNLYGNGALTIEGNVTTPASCVVNANLCFDVRSNSVPVTIRGFKVIASNTGVFAYQMGNVALGAMEFGACTGGHITANWGSRISLAASYTITGQSNSHFNSQFGSSILVAGATAITITGTLTFGTFASVYHQSCVNVTGITISGGTVSGTRYSLGNCSFTQGTSGNLNYFPGTVAGSKSAGSEYN